MVYHYMPTQLCTVSNGKIKILEIENNWLKRKFKEALHIAENILLMNIDNGLQVHSSWITCS